MRVKPLEGFKGESVNVLLFRDMGRVVVKDVYSKIGDDLIVDTRGGRCYAISSPPILLIGENGAPEWTYLLSTFGATVEPNIGPIDKTVARSLPATIDARGLEDQEHEPGPGLPGRDTVAELPGVDEPDLVKDALSLAQDAIGRLNLTKNKQGDGEDILDVLAKNGAQGVKDKPGRPKGKKSKDILAALKRGLKFKSEPGQELQDTSVQDGGEKPLEPAQLGQAQAQGDRPIELVKLTSQDYAISCDADQAPKVIEKLHDILTKNPGMDRGEARALAARELSPASPPFKEVTGNYGKASMEVADKNNSYEIIIPPGVNAVFEGGARRLPIIGNTLNVLFTDAVLSLNTNAALTWTIIDSHVFQQGFEIKPSRKMIIIGFLVGIVVGTILGLWLGKALLHY